MTSAKCTTHSLGNNFAFKRFHQYVDSKPWFGTFNLLCFAGRQLVGFRAKVFCVGHWCGDSISESLCCVLSVTLKSVSHSTDVKAPTSLSAQARGFTKTPPRKSRGNSWIKCVVKASDERIATTYSATYRSHRFCLNYPSHVISYSPRITLEMSLWSFRWIFMC